MLTSYSVATPVSTTCCKISIKLGQSKLWVKCAKGRSKSDALILIARVAAGVNLRIFSWRSRNTTPISVERSKLSISLLS